MPCAMTFMAQENLIFDILEPHAFKQAPEAGGCAIGDGGDRGDRGDWGDWGDRRDKGDRNKRGHRVPT